MNNIINDDNDNVNVFVQAQISGDKVYEGDLVSLKLTLTRENVPEVSTHTHPNSII